MGYMRDVNGRRLDSIDVPARSETVELYPLRNAAAPGVVEAVPRLLPGRAAISYPEHLGRFRPRLAAARFEQVSIAIGGNSIVRGQGSVVPDDEVGRRVRGWVPQLRDLFAARYGAVGEGAIHNGDQRVTVSGATAIASIGITGAPGGYRLDSSTEWVQLDTVDACTEVWIRFRVSSTTSRQLPQYTVDGGATQTIPDGAVPTGATAATYWHKITGLSSAPHTVRVLGQTVASKWTDLVGWQTRTSAQVGGVVVHRLGADGGYIGPSFAETGTALAAVTHDTLTPALLVLAFGSNEASVSANAADWTPERYEAALRNNIEYADTRGCDVLLVSCGRADPTTRKVIGEGPYFALHESLAAEYGYVAHLDIARLWGNYADAAAAGLLVDFIHPSVRGHSDMALAAYQALTA